MKLGRMTAQLAISLREGGQDFPWENFHLKEHSIMKYTVTPPINCSTHCVGYAQLCDSHGVFGLFCKCVYVPAVFSLGETFTRFIVLGKSVAVVQCHAIHGVICAVCLKLKKVVVDQIRITKSTQIVWLVSVIVLMFQQH